MHTCMCGEDLALGDDHREWLVHTRAPGEHRIRTIHIICIYAYRGRGGVVGGPCIGPLYTPIHSITYKVSWGYLLLCMYACAERISLSGMRNHTTT